MFVCGTCKKPFPLYGQPHTFELCQCSVKLIYTLSSDTMSSNYPTHEPIACLNYEALAARTEVPKAFYDAFEED